MKSGVEACAQALSQQLHPLEFLRLIFEDEALSRKDRTAKALTTKARFRFRADLEDWDFSFHKDLTKAKIQELCQLSFLHNLENLLILGKTGLGKTHLAIALGKRLCQEGHPTLFLPVSSRYGPSQVKTYFSLSIQAITILSRQSALPRDCERQGGIIHAAVELDHKKPVSQGGDNGAPTWGCVSV